MAKAFNKNNFNEEVLKSDVPVMVDFGHRGAGHARCWVPSSKKLQKMQTATKSAK